MLTNDIGKIIEEKKNPLNLSSLKKTTSKLFLYIKC